MFILGGLCKVSNSPNIPILHNPRVRMASSGTTSIRRHVAVCPFPFTSHLHHILNLSRKIAASYPGVLVSIFTPNPSAAAASLTAAEEEGSIRIWDIDNGLPVGAPPPANPLEALRSFLEVAPESLRKGVALAEEEVGLKISCVLTDGMMTSVGREVAEEKGVKLLVMWASSATTLATHLHTDQLRKSLGGPKGIEAHQDETVDKYIPGLPPIPITDLPYEILAVDDPVGRILHLMSLSLAKAAAVLINSFDALEPAATNVLNAAFPDKFLCAGCHVLTMPPPTAGLGLTQDPHGCLPWLDTHKAASVVYISFGSGLCPPIEEFASMAEALEATGVPFLWSIPDKFATYLPKGFEERTTTASEGYKCGVGKFVPWAPQMPVLRHVATGAQLTHCGWSSVVESIVAGVPMICRPSKMADHAVDARLVFDVWGVGVEMEGGRMTKTATEAALERVLLGEEGRRAREKIHELKRLAEEAAAEPNGTSALNMKKFINIIAT